jgi:tetratricopeptide (TPR) repeat protein
MVAKRAPALLVGAMMLGAASLTPCASVAADKPEDKPKISAAAAKPLKAAQDALAKQDWAGALAALKEAQDLPNKSEYEEFTTNQMLVVAYLHTNDNANAEKALEAVVGSRYLDKPDLPPRERTLTQLNYQLKDYDKAIQFGETAIKDGSANDETVTIVDQSYYLKGDYKGAAQSVNAHLATTTKAGQKPTEERLSLLLSSCVKLNDADCTAHALDLMVTYYPKPEYWQNILYAMIQTPGVTDRTLMQVFRLALDLDVLKRAEDYLEMAQLANAQGSPGEAERALEAGQQKNLYKDAALRTHATQMLESVKKQVAVDTASLPKIAADAEASKTGVKDAGLGLAYFSYQQYDKSIAALQTALTKGGLKSEPETRLLLGIAQLRSGKKDDALKTFDLVKGDPKLERMAALWEIRARQA